MGFGDELEQAVEQWCQKVIPPPSSSLRMNIGTNALSGRKLFLPIEGSNGLGSTHTYILGSSGVGKSKFLESLIRNLIEHRYGLLILDGKGDLYDDLLNYIALRDFYGHRLTHKTILIDPNDESHSPGLNYLEPLGKTKPDALASLVLEALKKFFHEDDEYKPWLEEWTPAALVPLIKAEFTLLELFKMVSDPFFREVVLSQLDEPFYKAHWDTLLALKSNDQDIRLGAIKTRAATFWQSDTLKALFGQTKTTIDWPRVMNEGGIVLARLGMTEKLSEKTAGLIGAALLHQIRSAASLRPQGARRPFFIIADEFQKFATSDFASGFDMFRGYGISLLVSHQHRGQLEKEAPELLESTDSNCRNKLIFATSRKSAEEMMLSMWSGWIHKGAGEIKDEIRQTKFRPVKTYETIRTFSDSDAYGDAVAVSSALSRTTSLVNGDALSMVEALISTHGSSSSRTSGVTETIVPFYDYEEFEEVSGRTFYTVEEVKERLIGWVKKQDDRHAQWQFKSKPPIPIITPTIKPVIVLDAVRERFVERVYAQSARPTQEVIQEIEGRAQRFLKHAMAALKTPRKSDAPGGHVVPEYAGFIE